MAIHAAEYLEKALQTPRLESPFQVGEYQLLAIHVTPDRKSVVFQR